MIRFLNAVPFLLGVGSGVGLLLCGRVVRSSGRFGKLALWALLTGLWLVLWVRTFGPLSLIPASLGGIVGYAGVLFIEQGGSLGG